MPQGYVFKGCLGVPLTTRAKPLICSLVIGSFCAALRRSPSASWRNTPRPHVLPSAVDAVSQRRFVERSRCQRQRGDVCGVSITLDNLRSNGCGLQTKLLANPDFVLRLKMAKLTDGATCLADAHIFAAASNRTIFRWISANQFSSFKPNVVGSACMP